MDRKDYKIVDELRYLQAKGEKVVRERALAHNN
jgi:hypothetical protein